MSLAINRLTLSDFRNYDSLRLEPPAGLIALVGPNGAGKTNVLEAISVLLPGQGLRGASHDHMARKGGNGSWAISALVEGPQGANQIGTRWQASDVEDEGPQRQTMLNGVLQRAKGITLDLLNIIWLTPAQDRLFAGAASERRRFLDRLATAFDAAHSRRCNAFEKLMRERNQLLENDRFDPAWADAIERQMAEHAVLVALGRLHAVQALTPHLAQSQIHPPFPWSDLSLQGSLEAAVAAQPARLVEEAYGKLLRDNRSRDRAAGRTLDGPHRSDFTLTHGPKSMAAADCSTGEQKALLIGLMLAQTRAVREATGVAPLLLLDEMTAHLDEARRVALLGALQALNTQVWMTGTEASLFAAKDTSVMVYHVENGHIAESK